MQRAADDAELQVGVRRRVELKRVAIRPDDDRLPQREQARAEILRRHERERCQRQRRWRRGFGHLGKTQFGRRGARDARAPLELVGQKSRRSEPAQRRLSIGHVEEFVGAELSTAETVGDDDAAFVGPAVHSGTHLGAAVPALAGGADLDLIVRTANAYRRLRGQQLVLVAVQFADLSGQRAESSAHQPEDRGLAAILPAGEIEALDAKLGVGLERDQRIVAEADLRITVGSGDDAVAGADRRARDQTDTLAATDDADVADRQQDLPGRLRKGEIHGERAQTSSKPKRNASLRRKMAVLFEFITDFQYAEVARVFVELEIDVLLPYRYSPRTPRFRLTR